MRFEFPAVKVLDYGENWKALEESDNPFATVVMAHLKTRETRHDEQQRAKWKLYLMRRLYERGYGREDIINLFRFIDWLMSLPEEAEERIWREIQEHEEAERMTYITSVERIGIKKGRQQGIREGLLDGIELGIELKFGSAGLRLLPEIRKIEDVDVLRKVHAGIRTATEVEELRLIYRPEQPKA